MVPGGRSERWIVRGLGRVGTIVLDLVAGATLLTGWVIAGRSSSGGSGAGVLWALVLVATAGAALIAIGQWLSNRVVVVLGLCLVAVSPTVFAYVLNAACLLIALAVVAVLLRARRSGRDRAGSKP